MKPYYQLKTHLTTSYLPLKDIIAQTLGNLSHAGEKELRVSAETILRCYAPKVVREAIDILDAPSLRQLRIALAEQLPMFCQEQSYILRQIKVSGSGMLISIWMKKAN